MREPKPLQEIFRTWMKNSGKEQLFYEIKIKQEWRELLGETIADKTKSLNWMKSDDILLVRISDPLLRNELNYAKDSIKEKLNEKLEEIQIAKILIV